MPVKSTIQSIDKTSDMDTGGPSGKLSKSGPPPASPRPRQAADSSLFSSAGQQASQQGQAGLGAEGGSPAMIGMQGMALVQRGLQMLNLAFPDNPGLMAVLADLTGRLQSIIPQLVSQQSMGQNSMGFGLMPPPQAAMPPGPPQGPGGGGMPPMGQAGPPQQQPPMPQMGR